ncbi:TetR family transcriptional regulator [Pseudoclavibacter sp. RFBG4]|uniref:ScbR family autoregulator-binding transcription factor n=1 Tax=Pseudoclavibacter sp. RFBG4 TaxID=2080575 RepID=UPI000CE7DD9A|nr:ScbR family autoregulator-binding transcription factor [Pseudoclavibacter sp. RFBG4]PPG34980.1 TetR family transcriptional regulator [Pseudoclavibacter sp. RFBG4]
MPRQDRAVRTRARILEAAAVLIQSSGYSDMSLARVSEDAHVTKGALYFHFPSKESLAVALIEQQHAVVQTDALVILASAADPVTKMVRLCEDLARKLMSDPIVRAGIQLTTDSGTLETPVRKPYEDWINTFAVLATEAVAVGAFTSGTKPETFANLLIPCFTGLQLVSESFSGRQDLPGRIADLWEVLIRASVPTQQVDERLLEAQRILLRTG